MLKNPETRFEVIPEEEAALLEAIAEADRGALISAAEVLFRLRHPPDRQGRSSPLRR